MALNVWWKDNPAERFWMEITRREDRNALLQAPRTKENGDAYWSYSLITLCEPGDVVYHYNPDERAIVAASAITERAEEAELLWGARGRSAREKGIQPHTRAGWRVSLGAFLRLPQPVTAPMLQARAEDMRGVLRDLEAAYRGRVYFPFQFKKRGVEAQQGYLMKFPAALVALFDELSPGAGLADSPRDREPTADDDELHRRADRLRRRTWTAPPAGSQKPRLVDTKRGARHERLPEVVAYVLHRAKGHCELCGRRPFLRTNGEPYLEVHHVRQLAHGGSDRHTNAVALCAGCHRELHHGVERDAKMAVIYLQVSELMRE